MGVSRLLPSSVRNIADVIRRGLSATFLLAKFPPLEKKPHSTGRNSRAALRFRFDLGFQGIIRRRRATRSVIRMNKRIAAECNFQIFRRAVLATGMFNHIVRIHSGLMRSRGVIGVKTSNRRERVVTFEGTFALVSNTFLTAAARECPAICQNVPTRDQVVAKTTSSPRCETAKSRETVSRHQTLCVVRVYGTTTSQP